MLRRYLLSLGVALAAAIAATSPAAAQVLRVGSFHGIPGSFSSIQAAVNAAVPGDIILVGPGDHKEHAGLTASGSTDKPAGVLITTPAILLRGMNRNTTIVDGTNPGSPACSSAASDQEKGPGGNGLNGILVWEANQVSIENLTACNFYNADGSIWWNGGDGSGQVGGYGYFGSYLTATTTFFKDQATSARYGIFSSNWTSGTWDNDYASNFSDSGFYIGACQNICNQTVENVWAEYNAVGYSGSNSGGQLVVENSQFDNNEDGADTNSQNGDNPPPQDGSCPDGGISPITHTHSCWVFMNNSVHDNNNPNVPPASDIANSAPVGTGMSVSGGRNDTIMNNNFFNNGAWGTIFVPFPDNGPPCTGGVNLPTLCLYDEFGDALLNNTYSNNGFFGNTSNGDVGTANVLLGPTDCYSGNTDNGHPITSSPTGLQQNYPSCNGSTVLPNLNLPFLDQATCDSQSVPLGLLTGNVTCLPGTTYPRRTNVVMHPLPSSLPTMPNPCSGVPANPWCSGTVTHIKACVKGHNGSAVIVVAPGERLKSVTLTVGRKSFTAKLHGRGVRLLVPIFKHRERVKFLVRIKVHSHREKFTFTNVYHHC